MKTFLSILAAGGAVLLAALSAYGGAANTYPQTNAAANVQFVGIVTNADGSFTTVRVPSGSLGGGVTTNGLTDPLAISFVESNNITDPYVQKLAQKHIQRLRTMAAFTNLQREFIFNPAYTTNYAELFGNTGTMVNPSQDIFGFNQNLTNYFTASLGAGYTNWTIIIFRKSNVDTFTSGSASLALEFSLEGAHNSAFFGYYNTGRNVQSIAQSDNVTTSFPSGTNANAAPWFCEVGMASSQNYMKQSFPSLTAYSSDGNGVQIGYQDGLQLFANNNAAITNLNTTFLYNNATNYQPVTTLFVGGGSTNWQNSYAFTLGTPPSRFCTNWFGSTFSVALFNTILSADDVRKYSTAVYELWPYEKKATVWFGDSMLAENNNHVNIYDFSQAPYSNCVPYYVALKHPYQISKNYSQGGATMASFRNVTYAGNTTGWWPTNTLTQFPSDWLVELGTDFPRNEAIASTMQVALAPASLIASNNMFASNLSLSITPYAKVVNKTFAYESPLWSTNLDLGFLAATNLPFRTNFVQTTINIQTNRLTYSLFNRYIHAQAYDIGNYWNTNNGYYISGYHLEGTNSPALMMKIANLFDSPEWQDAMPTPAQVW